MFRALSGDWRLTVQDSNWKLTGVPYLYLEIASRLSVRSSILSVHSNTLLLHYFTCLDQKGQPTTEEHLMPEQNTTWRPQYSLARVSTIPSSCSSSAPWIFSQDISSMSPTLASSSSIGALLQTARAILASLVARALAPPASSRASRALVRRCT